MSNTVATHIPENCRKEFLRMLQDNEKDILETKYRLQSTASDTLRYSSVESVATYAARLTGKVAERQVIIRTLRVIGLETVWDGEHPINVVPMEE